MGTWSIPGGRVEAGEDDQAATARELVEETGLEVVVGPFVGEVLRDAPNGDLYVIRDYRCALAPSADPVDVRAGDDAADAGWFTPAEIRSLDCAPGLVEALEQWGVLG
jgi:8-oxo-dGTP diphosphatase